MKMTPGSFILNFFLILLLIPFVGVSIAQTGHSGHGGQPAVEQKTPKKESAQSLSSESVEIPVVEFPADKQQFTGVKIKQAEIKPLTRKIRTIGRIENNEKSFVTVNTKFEGWIEKLYVNSTGKSVAKNEPLAEIYSPELYATQQEYLTLKKWAIEKKFPNQPQNGILLQKDSLALLSAAKQRLKLWDITDDQIRAIEKSGAPIRTIKIYSPVSGYILSKMAIQGMKIMPGEKLFDIADLSTVWVIADIYENEIAFIKQGQKAKITLSYFPGKPIEAVVDYIYPDLSAETRTVKVRFVIQNPDSLLKPQMFTNVELETDLGNRLVIPEEAIIDTGMRKLIYVAKDNDSFEPREVTTGIIADGMVEIVSGLKQGEKIASTGNFLIDSEAQLKGIIPADKH